LEMLLATYQHITATIPQYISCAAASSLHPVSLVCAAPCQFCVRAGGEDETVLDAGEDSDEDVVDADVVGDDVGAQGDGDGEMSDGAGSNRTNLTSCLEVKPEL
jgi:hypothetical protein